MLSYLEAGTKSVEYLRAVRRTCEYGQRTATNRDDRLLCRVRSVATAWTVDSAGRPMIEEFNATPGGESTQRAELFEVIVTPDERNRELIEKQECHVVSSGRPKRRRTGSTLNRRMSVRGICLRSKIVSLVHDRGLSLVGRPRG